MAGSCVVCGYPIYYVKIIDRETDECYHVVLDEANQGVGAI